jgi:hypothetical protein
MSRGQAPGISAVAQAPGNVPLNYRGVIKFSPAAL